jgi:hypothetical protein
MLVFDFIFDLLRRGRIFSVTSVAYLRFRELKEIEKYGIKDNSLFHNILFYSVNCEKMLCLCILVKRYIENLPGGDHLSGRKKKIILKWILTKRC